MKLNQTGQPSSNQHVPSHPASAGKIGMRATTFRDQDGRHVLLRGVNFGGDSKVPAVPNGHTYLPSNFRDHRTASFVGRPAPLDELDRHLARLKHWGFNCLRLLTTWEAVCHAGPHQHDEAYLDYFTEVCRRAGSFGLHVFVDFHQDVWSRMSGGDGAPGWTFEVAGLDFTRFHQAGAAHVMQHVYDSEKGGRQDAYPTMSWSGNYARPANGIMWTLFFAGRDLAPLALHEGMHVQDILQDSYFAAVKAVAERVAHLDNVIGFDTLNEPGTGYIGKTLDESITRGQGPVWTPLAGLAVASGLSVELPVYEYGRGVVGKRLINPDKVSIWLPDREDPFRQDGVWDVDASGNAVSIRPTRFSVVNGRPVDNKRDYMLPFFQRMATTVRAVRSDWLVFAEVDPFEAMRGEGLPDGVSERTVNASHWYDASALMTKRFNPESMVHVFTGAVRNGAKEIEDGYVEELSILKQVGDRLNGGSPTLIGECGIPYDMNGAEAFQRWARGEHGPEVWAAQTTALDLMYNAFDRLLLSSTQWNYTVSNRNDPMIGDGWCQEDLSIWSADQVSNTTDINSGARAIHGFCRPFVRAAQGEVIRQRFDSATGDFEAQISIDPTIAAPTEIFVPDVHYGEGYKTEVSMAAVTTKDVQTVSVFAAQAGTLVIRLVRE